MFQILVVDDDQVIQLMLTTILEEQGYEVITASNGEEGIAKAQKFSPGLILCDWMMPQLDGLEVCRRLKADPSFSTIFFIMLIGK